MDSDLNQPDFIRTVQFEVDFSLVSLDGHWREGEYTKVTIPIFSSLRFIDILFK